ncbi:MAG: matrixin family metalloprotease [Deltaproteobacteria bacterium]|nr:matrixin family metalloprotease [Deltaproteobacteria bacterium]
MRTTGLLVKPLIFSLLVVLLHADSAHAYVIADTVGDGSGEPLHWDTSEPVPFRFHFRGSDELEEFTLHRLTRASFQTWADVGVARFSFEEGRIFTGPAAHHGGPTEVDGQSAIFFIEANWPFAGEVIALTSVSFAADGEILDADIAFNGADHVFTTVETDGAKDFLSITTHEVGHFLGLGHSADTEATMFAEYEDGQTFLRDLNPDDEAGVQDLYPCNAEPCRGVVVWEDRKGCDAGTSGGGAGAALLFLALGGGLIRRRRSAGGAALAAGLVALVLMVPAPATSTLVEELPIEALAADADRIVRATVETSVAAFDGRTVSTRVTLTVAEDWAGSGNDTIEVVVPGGVLNEPVEVIGADGLPLHKPLAGTLVFGSPRLSVGDDIVVLIDGGAPGEGTSAVRGLAQGLFLVDEDGGVERDLSGLAFARVQGQEILPVAAPSTLSALRTALSR